MRSRVGGGEGIADRQARCLSIGAEEVDRALVLIRAAADDVAVAVLGRDNDRAHRAGHVGIGKAGGDHEVLHRGRDDTDGRAAGDGARNRVGRDDLLAAGRLEDEVLERV